MYRNWQAFVGLLLFVSVFSAEGYQNNFDQPLHVDCQSKKALSGVRSIYSTPHRDRRFQFLCQSITSYSFSKCFWTGYENQWDQPLLFQCPTDHVMSGVKSVHNNHREDRLWRFKCCKAPCHQTKSCELSKFINSWRGLITIKLPLTRCLWVPSAIMTTEKSKYKFMRCNLRIEHVIIPSQRP